MRELIELDPSIAPSMAFSATASQGRNLDFPRENATIRAKAGNLNNRGSHSFRGQIR
jgi:hypothetical protein